MEEKVTFKIKLADIPIGICALHDTTKQFCRKYFSEEEIMYSVEIDSADIEFERMKSAHEDEVEGIPIRHFGDKYLETLAVYRKIATRMPDYDTLLFHGSAIAVDGEGYLFTAKSGTGKSTHVRLWREMFRERAVMVNDDKPLLKVTDSGVTVYGTPWDGKHRLSNNIAVPLKALCILEQGAVNQIEEIAPRAAWPTLMQQSYRPREAEKLAKTMQLIDRLTSQVRLYRLRCNMEPEAAETSYEGMSVRP